MNSVQRKNCFKFGCGVLLSSLLVIMYIKREGMQISFNLNKLRDELKQLEESKDERYLPVSFSNVSPKTADCKIGPLKDLEDFFHYIHTPTINCHNLKEFGGARMKNDGAKMVCMDDRFKFPFNQCHVLSFGISNEWSFDDAIDAIGCHVYAFDPTMKKSDFNRTERIHFFHLGLSDIDGIKALRGKPCPVARYETILKKIGLLNETIHYLKMDIEGSEIQFFEDILKNSRHLMQNVNQIGMEIHPGKATPTGVLPTRFASIWQGMQMLECLGFKLVFAEKNRVRNNHYRFKDRTESRCYELVWIKDV